MGIEKTMQFILEMQAWHDLAIQGLAETAVKRDAQIGAVTDLVGRLEKYIETHGNGHRAE